MPPITAKQMGIKRVDQDELAAASHHNMAAAYDRGFFDDLVTPVPRASTATTTCGPTRRREKLATLKPVFGVKAGDATMTAGNSTPLTDGASVALLATEEWAAEHSLPPLAYFVDAETAAVDYVNGADGLLMAPTYAVPRLLARNGLTLQDFDFYEIHEAFASVVLAHLQAWESEEYCKERLGPGRGTGLASTGPSSTSTARRWPPVTRSPRPAGGSSRSWPSSSRAAKKGRSRRIGQAGTRADLDLRRRRSRRCRHLGSLIAAALAAFNHVSARVLPDRIAPRCRLTPRPDGSAGRPLKTGAAAGKRGSRGGPFRLPNPATAKSPVSERVHAVVATLLILRGCGDRVVFGGLCSVWGSASRISSMRVCRLKMRRDHWVFHPQRCYAILRATGRPLRPPRRNLEGVDEAVVAAVFTASGSVNQAAKAAGISHSSARKLLIAAGFVGKERRPRGKAEAKARFFELVTSGWSAARAAREVGVTCADRPRLARRCTQGRQHAGLSRWHGHRLHDRRAVHTASDN